MPHTSGLFLTMLWISRMFLLILIAATLGCGKPKPQSTPAPPPATAPAPRAHKKAPGPVKMGDLMVRNCTVAKEANGKADCICRQAVTHIDLTKNGDQPSLACK
jgi:hypothetical protein